MKMLFTVLLNLFVFQLSAQYTFFNPEGSFAIEVSLDNTSLKRLPIYRNSISSLTVVGDYIVGGTTAEEGLSPFIFTASLSRREMITKYDINNILKEQKSIRTGFCKLSNNTLYAGTITGKSSNEGGHLLKINVNSKGELQVLDLGIPVLGEGIFSLVANAMGTILYGITYPTGVFFSYNIKTRAKLTYKDATPSKRTIERLGEYVMTPDDYLCKALVEDKNGFIYGSMAINKLFYFNPADSSVHILKDPLPEVWGRRTLGQVEAWTKSKAGKIYGGNAGDGQLFEIDPETQKVKNLGKPIMMNHLRGLTFGRDRKLYGIAGALPGYAHLFSYDPLKEGYTDYGNPQFIMKAPGIEQGIEWRGFQMGTITSSEDGKYIVIGEDEALSQLLVFPVGKK